MLLFLLLYVNPILDHSSLFIQRKHEIFNQIQIYYTSTKVKSVCNDCTTYCGYTYMHKYIHTCTSIYICVYVLMQPKNSNSDCDRWSLTENHLFHKFKINHGKVFIVANSQIWISSIYRKHMPPKQLYIHICIYKFAFLLLVLFPARNISHLGHTQRNPHNLWVHIYVCIVRMYEAVYERGSDVTQLRELENYLAVTSRYAT